MIELLVCLPPAHHNVPSRCLNLEVTCMHFLHFVAFLRLNNQDVEEEWNARMTFVLTTFLLKLFTVLNPVVFNYVENQ